MKKLFCLILCAAMLVIPAAAADEVKIFIDGTELVALDADGDRVYPIIRGGTTYLPVRAVGQAFGRSVEWEGSTNTVYLGDKGTTAQSATAEVKIVLDGQLLDPRDADGDKVPPFIESGTTYLPVRAVGQAFGMDVAWDGNTRSVLLNTPAKQRLGDGFYRVAVHGAGKYMSVSSDGSLTPSYFSGSDSQVWSFSYLGDGYYQFVNRSNGQSLDVSSFNTAAGTAVGLYESNGGTNQTLEAVMNADGTYSFKFRHSGLFLTAGDNDFTQEQAGAGLAQSFDMEFVEESFMTKVLSSPGYAALGEMGERFRSYLYSDISFSYNVKAQAEAKLISAGYFNLDAEAQSQLLRECMQLTAYYQVWLNNIPNESGATYEITSIDYNPSYDVWRGTMKPVWIHHVRMTGDVPGQVHEFIMVSTDEHSSMIHDSLRAMARFPYAMRKYITRMIYRDDEANSFNADYANVYMRIIGTRNEEEIALLLAHELGHTLDQNCGNNAIWDKAVSDDGVAVSSYGNTNHTEDLAEYSRLYHSVKKDPQKLAIVESIYPNRSRAYQAMLYLSDSEYYSQYRQSFYEVSGINTAGVEALHLMSGGQYLTADGDKPNSEVSLTAADAGGGSLWRLYPTNDGYYVAFNELSGLCLNVPGNSKESGKGIILWNGGTGANEKMTKIDNGDGTFKLRFLDSGLYLAVSGGKAIQSATGADWILG